MTLGRRLDPGEDILVYGGALDHLDLVAKRMRLDGGARGWLAIDPKGLMGDPTYDYAIMLCLNPDTPAEGPAKAVDVARRVPVVAAMAGLSAPRLLAWTTCLCALYSAWFEGHEGVEPWVELTSDLLRDFADQMGIT